MQLPRSVDTAEALGRELGPELEVVRPLATSTTGHVYLGREPLLKRFVAVKVLSRELAADDVARRRFEREATAAAALDHPNAVRVYRFGFLSSGLPYLVMQYVDGVTLEERVEAEGPLAVPEVRRILADVAGALAEAHRHGFIHRDVRPDNVLYDPEHDRALLVDFGLAGLLPRASADAPRLTRAGEVLSEAGFASPEQLVGDAPTEQSDVYALGVTGYVLLTGAGPFRADSERALQAAHLRSPPRPLRALRPEVDPAMAELLERCLAKDPRRRPAAAHVARVLREPTGGGAGAPGRSGRDLVDDLLQRRLPQTVAVTLVAGYAALSFVDQLADRDVLPELAYSLSLSTFGFGLAASGILAWFHGKTGRQRVAPLELGLLSLVGAGWLLTCLLIVLT